MREVSACDSAATAWNVFWLILSQFVEKRIDRFTHNFALLSRMFSPASPPPPTWQVRVWQPFVSVHLCTQTPCFGTLSPVYPRSLLFYRFCLPRPEIASSPCQSNTLSLLASLVLSRSCFAFVSQISPLRLIVRRLHFAVSSSSLFHSYIHPYDFSIVTLKLHYTTFGWKDSESVPPNLSTDHRQSRKNFFH